MFLIEREIKLPIDFFFAIKSASLKLNVSSQVYKESEKQLQSMISQVRGFRKLLIQLGAGGRCRIALTSPQYLIVKKILTVESSKHLKVRLLWSKASVTKC